jgi:CMP/dCMP kinase
MSEKIRITISGEAGSGKSTVADIIANKLQIKRHSTGDYMRTMAAARGVTIIELNKIAETDPSIDKELDEWQMKLDKKTNEAFVIDSRLGFHFIPSALSVFLKADFDKRAERIFNTRRLTEENMTLEQTKENIKRRQELDRNRYIEKYDADYLDHTNFDLLIDTTEMTPEQVADAIIRFVKEREISSNKDQNI